MFERRRTRRRGVLATAEVLVCVLASCAGGAVARAEVPRAVAGVDRDPRAVADADAGGAGDLDAVDPATARIELSISRARAAPGALVALDLRLLSEVPLRSLVVAVNFAESSLEFAGVRGVAVVAPAEPLLALEPRTRDDNTDAQPGDQSNEGWIQIEFDPRDDGAPALASFADPTTILRLWFRVRIDARRGFAPVRLEDVGPVRIDDRDEILRNVAYVDAVEVDFTRFPDVEVADDGGVIIEGVIGEVGFFLRGDANMDCQRDVSDAVKVLHYLFTGEDDLPCSDSADADDNAVLDVGDPVFTLNWLFALGRAFPEPFAHPLEDPTQDYELFCIDGFDAPDACAGSR